MVCLADHNISSSVRKQLVLEMEIRIGCLELIGYLPSSFTFINASPLDENMPDTPPQLRTNSTFWHWYGAAILNWWQD